MTPQQKKWLVAREGLILLVCLLVGFFVVPVVLFTLACIAGHTDNSFASFADDYTKFLRDLFAFGDQVDPVGRLFAPAFVLGPYVILQLARSIVWSLKRVIRGHL
jgi:hypothetical protein